jgi:hypothetical protein
MLGLTLHQTNGVTIAHLKYLEDEGKVGREVQEQGIVFFTEVSNA